MARRALYLSLFLPICLGTHSDISYNVKDDVFNQMCASWFYVIMLFKLNENFRRKNWAVTDVVCATAAVHSLTTLQSSPPFSSAVTLQTAVVNVTPPN